MSNTATTDGHEGTRGLWAIEEVSERSVFRSGRLNGSDRWDGGSAREWPVRLLRQGFSDPRLFPRRRYNHSSNLCWRRSGLRAGESLVIKMKILWVGALLVSLTACRSSLPPLRPDGGVTIVARGESWSVLGYREGSEGCVAVEIGSPPKSRDQYCSPLMKSQDVVIVRLPHLNDVVILRLGGSVVGLRSAGKSIEVKRSEGAFESFGVLNRKEVEGRDITAILSDHADGPTYSCPRLMALNVPCLATAMT